MNPDNSQTGAGDLEARLTALLLGELPPAEAAEVQAALARDPELNRLYQRLQRALSLVREATVAAGAETAAATVTRRLSPERRERLLSRFKVIAPRELASRRRGFRLPWYIPMSAAAGLVALLAVGVLMSPTAMLGSKGKGKMMDADERGIAFYSWFGREKSAEARAPMAGLPQLEHARPAQREKDAAGEIEVASRRRSGSVSLGARTDAYWDDQSAAGARPQPAPETAATRGQTGQAAESEAVAADADGARRPMMMDPRMLMRYGLLPKGFKLVEGEEAAKSVESLGRTRVSDRGEAAGKEMAGAVVERYARVEPRMGGAYLPTQPPAGEPAVQEGVAEVLASSDVKAELAPLPLKLPVPAFMGTPTDLFDAAGATNAIAVNSAWADYDNDGDMALFQRGFASLGQTGSGGMGGMGGGGGMGGRGQFGGYGGGGYGGISAGSGVIQPSAGATEWSMAKADLGFPPADAGVVDWGRPAAPEGPKDAVATRDSTVYDVNAVGFVDSPKAPLAVTATTTTDANVAAPAFAPAPAPAVVANGKKAQETTFDVLAAGVEAKPVDRAEGLAFGTGKALAIKKIEPPAVQVATPTPPTLGDEPVVGQFFRRLAETPSAGEQATAKYDVSKGATVTGAGRQGEERSLGEVANGVVDGRAWAEQPAPEPAQPVLAGDAVLRQKVERVAPTGGAAGAYRYGIAGRPMTPSEQKPEASVEELAEEIRPTAHEAREELRTRVASKPASAAPATPAPASSAPVTGFGLEARKAGNLEVMRGTVAKAKTEAQAQAERGDAGARKDEVQLGLLFEAGGGKVDEAAKRVTAPARGRAKTPAKEPEAVRLRTLAETKASAEGVPPASAEPAKRSNESLLSAGVPLAKEPAVEGRPIAAAPRTPAAAPQPEVVTAENPISTFSLNVTDVSFKLAAASLERGAMPDPGTVRSEEFLNAFGYRDPEPVRGAAVAFAWERAQYPFAHNRDMLRFAVRTAARGREAARPLNLVLLLDNSGSMERADRVAIIRESLAVLARQLQPQDRISVVAFARTPRLWVDALPGSEAGDLVERVGGLVPEGGTNLGEALELAYATAARHFMANGVNRVVVLTDGAANLGDVDPESLKRRVESQRQHGIALDCFGIGWEGYNDDLLEVLSRNGDGRYGFVNTPEEAASELAGQLAGALEVAAADVKVQVEFNPRRVSAWRQIGYAKHQLTKEQFRDNRVDAAELGAAESGNALYVVEVNPAGDGPLGVVRVRFRVPSTGQYRELAWPVPYTGPAVALDRASPAMRLAVSAVAFAEWLVSSPFAAEVSTDRLLEVLRGVPESFGPDPRPRKLEWMIRQAKAVGE